jgi:CRP-like cAMP-binding protein
MTEVLKQYIASKVSLSEEEVAKILACFKQKKLRKKQYLLQEGDVCHFIAFIAKGCLRLYRVDDKGNEHIVQFGFENYWMSERESAFSQKPTQYCIDAVEDSEVLVCQTSDFMRLQKEIPAFEKMMMDLQSKNFGIIQKRINSALSYSAEEKYQELLHFQPEIIQRIPSTMVAAYLGISRETLSRIRNQSQKK